MLDSAASRRDSAFRVFSCLGARPAAPRAQASLDYSDAYYAERVAAHWSEAPDADQQLAWARGEAQKLLERHGSAPQSASADLSEAAETCSQSGLGQRTRSRRHSDLHANVCPMVPR